MARPSGGTIPPVSPIADSNQALTILDTMHFWSAKKTNNADGRTGVEVCVVQAGRRVRVRRRTFVLATIEALAKLRSTERTFMRLAR